MASEYRPLLMKANRLFGASLVDANLVKIEDLEKANERLLELFAAGQPRQNTVLGVLVYEMKKLREEDVLLHAVEHDGIGLVDLSVYDVPEAIRNATDTSSCWATWSVPFDQEEDFHFVASAYYLSPAVRAYWEKQLDGSILWFGVTLETVADYLEKLELERAVPAAVGTRPPHSPPKGSTSSPIPIPGVVAPATAGDGTPPSADGSPSAAN